MITEAFYQKYLALLLDGNRRECARIVQQLLDRDIEIKSLYADLFQKSLYEVGLSVSVYFNMPALKSGLAAIRENFNHLDIMVGGQAFKWGGTEIIKQFGGTAYVPSIDRLSPLIAAGKK